MTESPPTVVDNYIDGAFVPPTGSSTYWDVSNPANSEIVGRVAVSTAADVDAAVQSAQTAWIGWSERTIKSRAAIMLRFHGLLRDHTDELAALIVRENGKNLTEAKADVAKGNETVEYACSLPQLAAGRTLAVSSGGVECRDVRKPLGVVTSIVPFNFPCMVPLWTLPIALVLGNTIVLKPSEKVPLTMHRVVQLLTQAGLPPGVCNLVQGGSDAAKALIEHPLVKAVTFVGSSPVARIVQETASQLHKRCTALGGAKNHLVALPDCHRAAAAHDICASFAGCAGQRCMAASVLLLVNSSSSSNSDNPSEDRLQQLLDLVVAKAAALEMGTEPGQVGPVIDQASYDKIQKYIALAEQDGAKVLLDGRIKGGAAATAGGNWVGPTILLHTSAQDRTMREEVFGPVLSVYRCQNREEAIDIENANPFGNAASIYTSHGGHAQWFHSRFRAAMLGTNIGIPVPREPFSFGGLYGTQSKYGDQDITGDGGMEFFSNRVKITSKWPVEEEEVVATNPITNGGAKPVVDQANFAGSM